jgi:hypothetical protein
MYCSRNMDLRTGWIPKLVHGLGHMCSPMGRLYKHLRAVFKSQAIAQMIIRHFGIYTRLQCIALEIWTPGLDRSQSRSMCRATCVAQWAVHTIACKLYLSHRQ